MRTERAIALVFGALAFATAHSETSPYYLGANGGVSHDSNIFRSETDPAGDTTWSGGLVAGFDQPIGRQRIFANGAVSDNRHVRFSRLDDISYNLSAGADWATIERLSGSVRLASSSGLADYGLADAPQTTEKNILRTQQLMATAAWDLHSQFNLEASLEHDSLDYSTETYRTLDTRQNVLGLDMRYGAELGWSAAMGGRITRGVTPFFQVRPEEFEPDEVQRQDLDLLSIGYHSPKTSITARVSHSHETHTQSVQPGFSGFTGSIFIDYAPTSKVHLSVSASRDTGTATTFLRFAAASLNVDASEVSNQFYASATFAVAPKVNLGLVTRYNRGENSSPFGTSRNSNGAYVLQASYEPRPALRFSCSIDREIRASTTPGFDTRAAVIGCSGVATIR